MDDDQIGQPHTCRALAKSTGQRCRNNVGPFAVVCRVHGGRSPRARAAADERARRAGAERACEALGLVVEVTPEDSLQAELNHTAAMVRWLRAQLAGMTAEFGADWLVTADGVAWGRLHLEERDHLVKICRVMLAADVRGRLTDVAQQVGAAFVSLVDAFADGLSLTDEQRQRVPELVPRLLRSLAVPDDDGAA